MAYAFDQINSALGQQAGEQGGANIFGQDTGAGSSGQGTQNPVSGGSAEAPKTTTEGQLSAGMAGSSGAGTPKPQVTAQTSGQAILDKAKKSNLDTGFASKIVGDIKQGEQTLKNEANAYTAAQGAKAQGAPDIGGVTNAVNEGTNSAAYKNVEALLRGPSNRADQFTSGVSNQFQDIDQIGTQGGLQSYLKKRGNENYTEGQAALDSLLFSRDKGFQGAVQAAKNERDSLKKQKQDYEATLQNQAQQQIDAVQGTAKQNATSYLKDRQAQMQAEAQAKIAAENARRAEVHNNFGRYKDASLASVYDSVANAAPHDKGIIEKANAALNRDQYIRDNYRGADIGDVVDGAQAQKFNAILGLLGQGGSPVSSSQGQYQDYTFEGDRYRNDLMNEINRLKGIQTPTKHIIGGGVKGGNNANAISDVLTGKSTQPMINTALENPIETIATGGMNVQARQGGKEIKKKLKL